MLSTTSSSEEAAPRLAWRTQEPAGDGEAVLECVLREVCGYGV